MTNGGWVLIFTKLRDRLKVVKESFNSVDVLNRFKSIKLQDCKLIVFCGNITAKYIKDIKLRVHKGKHVFISKEDLQSLEEVEFY